MDLDKKKIQMLLVQQEDIDISLEVNLLNAAMKILNGYVDSLGNNQDHEPKQTTPVSISVNM